MSNHSEIRKIVRDLVEQNFGPAPFKIGDRVKHPDGRMVEITGGQYWGTYGFSNFWDWQEVLPDGRLARKKEHGYGWRPS